jgi:hypothetical protein
MSQRPARAAAWFLLVLLAAAGCGDKHKSTVHGTVTYEGQKVQSGYVSFYPQDGKGAPVGGEIEDGEYSVDDVPIGKNRVEVIPMEAKSPADGNPTRNREGANEERLNRMKKRQPAAPPAVPKNATGNNEVVDISPGVTKLDIPLGKPGGR